VGQIVGWILQSGEALPGAQTSSPAAEEPADVSKAPAATASEAPHTAAATTPPTPAATAATRQLRATPLARSLAREHGIDLHSIQGSGPNGRVLGSDLPASASALAASAHQPAKNAAVAGGRVVGAGASLHLHWFSGKPATAEAETTAPVILLHGFGTSLGSWRPLSLELKDFPLAGIDLPNHGKSPRMATPDLASVAEAVLRRLDEEGITSLHLVGHSMGGGTALALAGLLGARLKSLTLIAPAAMGPEINGAFVQGLVRASREESLRPWLAQLFGDASRLSGSFVATAWKELESADRRAGLAEMADRLLPDGTQAELLRAGLDELMVPVKVIWGTLDRVVPYRQSAGLPAAVALHTL
ncbi:MAG: alpha/beta fold hydrolase, partial [Comamonadaceae bacterium]